MRVGWLTFAGLLLLAACGGRSRDGSRLDGSVNIDAGSSPSVTDDDRPPIARGCPGAVPVITGLDQCMDGLYHRTGSWQCELEVPQGDLSPEDQALLAEFFAQGGSPRRVECMSHSDCNERLLGQCNVDPGNVTVANCSYNCLSDADCDPGNVCYCVEGISACLPSSCRSDDDCAPGFACTSSDAIYFACESPEDQCRTNTDCTDGRACLVCNGRRSCEPVDRVCQP
jgi:hypothetical protein